MTNKTIKAGIVGVTGYTGVELLRLLQQHPVATVTYAATESYAGQKIADIFPHLTGVTDLHGEKIDPAALAKNCDVIFLALPHGHASELTTLLLAEGKKVIDLGADFRLHNPLDYQQWYQQPAAATSLLAQAVYGLPEKGEKENIAQAKLIANPGCYPTAAILATLPALKAKIIAPNECIFDAKSGISGAGRSLALQSHYCEAAENLSPYQIGGLHRHTPEIEQELSLIAGQAITVQFTPHLIPVARGLLTAAYFKLIEPLEQEEVQAVFQEFYQHEKFIRVCPPTQIPQITHVRGTNNCHLGLRVDSRTQRLIVISVIDNLIKGAAGQAIQNMNLMYQLPETTGLYGNAAIFP
jgi:N-acetyl-gamma-glutamyl-phosphate reductase